MRQFRQFIPVVLVGVLLLLALSTIRRELGEYRLQDVIQSLDNIPNRRKLIAIALTGLGYSAMTGYDFLACRYIRRSLSAFRIAFTSFLSYAFGNTIGFTLFSGTAIRYRYYASQLTPAELVKVVVFTHFSFWLGMLAIGGIVFWLDPLTIPQMLQLPFQSIHPIGMLLVLLAVLYLVLSTCLRAPLRICGQEFGLPSLLLSLAVIAVSVVDWTLAAGVLYQLLPQDLPLSFFSFFGIYVLAMTAGIVSTVPGGLGVFEAVILVSRPAGVSASEVLGGLLAFRGIYYFLPLLLAGGLALVYEFLVRRKQAP
ncbi:MAG: UPF0104 family protein [Synechococcales cyanobacterium M58_A2018_015]|nr:UPF0104 family protein [Synechococcales cyanobacterium M58_A2018_015]